MLPASTSHGVCEINSLLVAGGMGEVYVSQTFIQLGKDLEPLRRYAKELIAPFEQPGSDLLAEWYRNARKTTPQVCVAYSHAEAGPTRALFARHVEGNALGDAFTEDSFLFEPVHHVELTDAALIARHLAAVLGEGGREVGMEAESHLQKELW